MLNTQRKIYVIISHLILTVIAYFVDTTLTIVSYNIFVEAQVPWKLWKYYVGTNTVEI